VVKRFIGHADFIRDMALLKDRSALVSISGDGYGLLWDIATASRLVRYKGCNPGYLTDFVISNDETLVVGVCKLDLLFWNRKTGALVKTLSFSRPVTDIVMKPNSPYLLYVGFQETGLIHTTTLPRFLMLVPLQAIERLYMTRLGLSSMCPI